MTIATKNHRILLALFALLAGSTANQATAGNWGGYEMPPQGYGQGNNYAPAQDYGYGRSNHYTPDYNNQGYVDPWTGKSEGHNPWRNQGSGFNTPWNNNNSGFTTPWNNNGSGFSGPWNNRGSNFGMPWNNNGWGNGGRNPLGPRSMNQWASPNRNNMADNWDDMLNAPSRMGTMPGGWNAPSVSVPNPIDVGDEFGDAARDMPDQMDNFRYNR